MWRRCNVNPAENNTGDCVIRACAVALNRPWLQVSDEIYDLSRRHFLSMSDDRLWGRYLYEQGFVPFILPESCPSCITIKRFCKMYPRGVYIIGTGTHAVAALPAQSGSLIDTSQFVTKSDLEQLRNEIRQMSLQHSNQNQSSQGAQNNMNGQRRQG